MKKLLEDELGGELLSHGEEIARCVVRFGLYDIHGPLVRNLRKTYPQMFESLDRAETIALSLSQRVNGIKLAAYFYLSNMLLLSETPKPFTSGVTFNPAGFAVLDKLDNLPACPTSEEVYYGMALAMCLETAMNERLRESAPPQVEIHIRSIKRRLEKN